MYQGCFNLFTKDHNLTTHSDGAECVWGGWEAVCSPRLLGYQQALFSTREHAIEEKENWAEQ